MLRGTMLAGILGVLLAACGPYARSHGTAARPTPRSTAGRQAFTGMLSGTATAPACGGAYNLDNAPVEVRDEHDAVIGTGTTRAIEIDTYLFGPGHYRPGYCQANFSVSGLPKARLYRITIGTRAGTTFSYEDLAAKGWIVELNYE